MLEKINNPDDLKKLSVSDLQILSKEIRDFLVSSISKTGGHLGSNLGMVELSIALNYIYDFKKDAIVFDVGHQSYVHKILTERKELFNTLRQFKGLCGFPNILESPYDHFDTGHASTSISAASGMAKAFELNNKNYHSVAVIGDGALSGGLAYEALNNVGEIKSPLLIILNDNEMSISKNVGGLSKYLNLLRSSKKYHQLKDIVKHTMTKVPLVGNKLPQTISLAKQKARGLFIQNNFFEALGIKYLGPIDGHNLPLLIDVINNIKDLKEPVLLHVLTKKGKGYEIAENDPFNFHGVEPFNYDTGDFYQHNTALSYTACFGQIATDLAKKHNNVIAITAAMSQGCGLETFKQTYPKRFFDVGIAEAHALTFAAGLAAKGFKPIVAIYSTFLQRGLDQIIHDICLQKLNVIIAIDRAGIVGKDGKTHQGLFDIGFLDYIPNLVILAPSTKEEMQQAFEFAYNHHGPCAIRYPRGSIVQTTYPQTHYELGKGEIVHKGEKGLIIGLGSLIDTGIKLAKDFNFTYYDLRFVKPLDQEYLKALAQEYQYIFVLEEVIKDAGVNLRIRDILDRTVYSLSLENDYLEHGAISDLYKLRNFDYQSLKIKIEDIIKNKE